jgi:hypothetical protein
MFLGQCTENFLNAEIISAEREPSSVAIQQLRPLYSVQSALTRDSAA